MQVLFDRKAFQIAETAKAKALRGIVATCLRITKEAAMFTEQRIREREEEKDGSEGRRQTALRKYK